MTTAIGTLNLTAITQSMSAAELAFESLDNDGLMTALTDLYELVGPLHDSPAIQARTELLLNEGMLDQHHLDLLLAQIRRAVQSTSEASKRSGRRRTLQDYRVQIRQGIAAYKAREDQKDLVKKGVEHFGKEEKNGRPKQRGIARYDTGMGKSLTYGFMIRELRKKYPGIFKDAVIIMGSHQEEPALSLAVQIKALFPDEEVLFMQGGVTAADLKKTRFVVGSYQQLAQEKTVALLKLWAGKRRVLFVLDEADMVVFKGIHADRGGEDEEANRWHPSWIKPFIEFGVFDAQGRYNFNTRHHLLGATATLDRPDGIPLSTFWGPGNIFHHVPMTNGINKGLLVPIIGIVAEMDVPPDAVDKKAFKDFVTIRDGKLVVDKGKVKAAAGSDYSVKTAVRAALDNMMMQTGIGDRKRKALRRGIGYTMNKAHLEKHMRWNQELFDLVELVFHISNGLFSEGHPIRSETILQNLQEFGGIDGFGDTLKRFLFWNEWKAVSPLFERAKNSLLAGRKEGVKELFAALYKILNIELRRIKGSRLVATAAWESMDHDAQGRMVKPDRDSSTEVTLANFPNNKWPNRFGSRRQTMRGFNDGAIDMLWSIGMLDRGFNEPMASLAVDNAYTYSRREVVQRVGRILRPPDGRNPYDHSKKPNAVYVTVTENLTIHRLDLSRMDIARVFGREIDPELRVIHIGRGGEETPWKTADPVQLDLGEQKKVHVVKVGAKTAQAVLAFLHKKYGADFDEEVAAFDAEMSVDDFHELFNLANRPYKEKDLLKWLDLWEADVEMVRKIRQIFHSDLAEMRTVYSGDAWRILSEGGK